MKKFSRTSETPAERGSPECIRWQSRFPSEQIFELFIQSLDLRTLTLNGRLVVTWRRAGDTCVLSGSGVTAAELQTLAAWKVPAESR